MVKFDLNDRASKDLEKALAKQGADIEKKLNDFIHVQGAKRIIQAIIGFMPRSDRKKQHAKDSQSLKSISRNLAVDITTKAKFRYLVFPDDGIGRHNRIAQQFSTKGLKSVEVDLMNQIIEVINEGTDLE